METQHERIAREIERLGEEHYRICVELDDTKAERDEGWAKFKALRAAARAFLEDASMPRCGVCSARGEKRLVTRGYRGWFACDEHAQSDWPELSHASALRAISALLEASP